MSSIRPILLVLLMAGPLWAMAVEDARREVHQARHALEAAEQRLRDAQGAVEETRQRRDALWSHLKSLPGWIAQERSRQWTVRWQIGQAEQTLPGLHAAMNEAEAQMGPRRSALADAQGRADAARAGFEQANRQAIAQFEDSDAFVSARSAAEGAGQELDRLRGVALATLAQTSTYQQQAGEVAAAEQQVRQMRADPNVTDDILADVSRRWMDARSALGRMEQDQVEGDLAVRSARQRLDEATANLRQLQGAFSQQLAVLPEVVAARQALEGEQQQLTRTNADVQEAENALAAARSDYDRQVAWLNAANADLRDSEGRLASLEWESCQGRDELRRLEWGLSFAQRSCEEAGRQRDWAARCLADAQRQEELARHYAKMDPQPVIPVPLPTVVVQPLPMAPRQDQRPWRDEGRQREQEARRQDEAGRQQREALARQQQEQAEQQHRAAEEQKKAGEAKQAELKRQQEEARQAAERQRRVDEELARKQARQAKEGQEERAAEERKAAEEQRRAQARQREADAKAARAAEAAEGKAREEQAQAAKRAREEQAKAAEKEKQQANAKARQEADEIKRKQEVERRQQEAQQREQARKQAEENQQKEGARKAAEKTKSRH